MTFTAIPTITTGDVATAAWGNTYLKDNFDHILTAGGLLKHEAGGIELDISAITTGGLLQGASAGVMKILAVGAANRILQVNSGGTDIEWGAVQARIATGSYTGDGATSQAITGVGFQPSFVVLSMRVTADGGAWLALTADVIVDDNAAGGMIDISNNTFDDNSVISLDADGFTVDDNGANEHPNQSSVTYNYVAIG